MIPKMASLIPKLVNMNPSGIFPTLCIFYTMTFSFVLVRERETRDRETERERERESVKTDTFLRIDFECVKFETFDTNGYLAHFKKSIIDFYFLGGY